MRLLFEQPQMCKIADVNEEECVCENVSVWGACPSELECVCVCARARD